MNPTDARLFPDFAAVPTAAERRSSRTYWRAAQRDMFADLEPAHCGATCPVCAGDHAADACTIGTAPEMFDAAGTVAAAFAAAIEEDEPRPMLAGHITRVHRLARGEAAPFRPTGEREHQDDAPSIDNSAEARAARRAMFQRLGWGAQ